jgi:hypothetical protein
MENEEKSQNKEPEFPAKNPGGKTFVYTVRDWKEYLGESLLIIFSVLLALLLTEFFNYLHSRENTHSLIREISQELRQNRKNILEIKDYDAGILGKINQALTNKSLQDSIVENDVFHLDLIAPQGALYRYLNNEAWTVAKNNDIISRLDVETSSLLTRVYEDQTRMMKVEDEVARVIMDRASRDPRQIHTTLILIRDIYHAWAVDRTDAVVQRIDETLKKMEAGL